MSDRIAVFNDGRIQQLAPPEDLYERPENAFVAQFIGENNRLAGTVATLEGGFATVDLDRGGRARALAVSCGGAGDRTQLSIRPERVAIGGAVTENAVEARVLELIYLGDHIRCRMQVHGDDGFIVKVPNDGGLGHLAVGDTARIGWAAEDCRALDA